MNEWGNHFVILHSDFCHGSPPLGLEAEVGSRVGRDGFGAGGHAGVAMAPIIQQGGKCRRIPPGRLLSVAVARCVDPMRRVSPSPNLVHERHEGDTKLGQGLCRGSPEPG